MSCLLLLSSFSDSMFFFFFFNDTATTEIYTLSLHDALPICAMSKYSISPICSQQARNSATGAAISAITWPPDRKSTRLNSSHSQISYAVFCLKKKKKHQRHRQTRQHMSHAGATRLEGHEPRV